MIRGEKTKGGVMVLIILSFVFLLCFRVSAFGVAMPYWGDNHLTLAPGETKIVEVFKLKLASGEQALKIKASMLEDGGIATLAEPDKEYDISPGQEGGVSLKLKIPKNATEGTAYDVRIQFHDVTPRDSNGMVGLRGGSIASLRVYVEKEKQTGILWSRTAGVLVLVCIIIAAAIAIILVMRRLLSKNSLNENSNKKRRGIKKDI